MAKGWFYDIQNSSISHREDDGSKNSGDYHHHDWVGPYKSFSEAKKEGLSMLRTEKRLLEKRIKEFDSLRLGVL